MNKSRADARPAEAVIGPAARALEAHIEAAVARILSGRPERTPQNGLLFLSS
ncbi:MAG: hypothetical protein ACREYE_09655 [Gammaproteobacteria bacterium]